MKQTIQADIYDKKYGGYAEIKDELFVSRQTELFLEWLDNSYCETEEVSLLDLGGGVCYLGQCLRNADMNGSYAYTNYELSATAVEQGKVLGFENVIHGSIPERGELPFESDSFDIIHCSHVVEHLVNPDILFEESMRILKPGGVLYIATPNLASWIGRIMVLCGWQGYGQEISVKFGTAGKGPLGKIVYGEGGVGHHLRVFTMAGLKDMMHLHGFKLIYSKGVRTFSRSKRRGMAGFMLNCAAVMDGIASICSGLACNIVCIGEKEVSEKGK